MTTEIVSTQTNAVEKKYLDRLLKLNPGLGEKAKSYVESLTECGLTPTEGMMLIEAVYSPTNPGKHAAD